MIPTSGDADGICSMRRSSSSAFFATASGMPAAAMRSRMSRASRACGSVSPSSRWIAFICSRRKYSRCDLSSSSCTRAWILRLQLQHVQLFRQVDAQLLQPVARVDRARAGPPPRRHRGSGTTRRSPRASPAARCSSPSRTRRPGCSAPAAPPSRTARARPGAAPPSARRVGGVLDRLDAHDGSSGSLLRRCSSTRRRRRPCTHTCVVPSGRRSARWTLPSVAMG